MTNYQLNPINDYGNEKVNDLLHYRIRDMDIEERVRATSMSPMFSFWREVQECMIAAADEIARLKARVKELEDVSNDGR